MHCLQLFLLLWSSLVDELWQNCDLSEVVKCLVVPEVQTVTHNIHLVKQAGCALFQLPIHLVNFLCDLFFSHLLVFTELVLIFR